MGDFAGALQPTSWSLVIFAYRELAAPPKLSVLVQKFLE